MAFWLLKQEPGEFSYADLEAAGKTTWDGVSNPLAQKHLRAMQPGDEAFFYHTGNEKAVVGIVRITTSPTPDPSNEKLVTVEVEAVRRLAAPVALAAIKADPKFAEWELVRMSRLSVMPVPKEIWKAIEAMGKGTRERKK